MLPCVISQDIVKYLHEVKGFSLEEIADIISMPVDYIEGIVKGLNTLNQESIGNLIKNSDEPMISILSKACSDSHLKAYLTEKIRKNVLFYKQIQKSKKKRPK